jgi:hypothetical protein
MARSRRMRVCGDGRWACEAVCRAAQVSRGRIAGNDRPNAELVASCRDAADVLVPSTVPFKGPA